jgi:hypothetical protein
MSSYSGLGGIDVLANRITTSPGCAATQELADTPGHNKFDLRNSIGKLRPDAIHDVLSWGRHRGNVMFEFVKRNHVQSGSFWLRRDSPHVHWDRLPPH